MSLAGMSGFDAGKIRVIDTKELISKSNRDRNWYARLETLLRNGEQEDTNIRKRI